MLYLTYDLMHDTASIYIRLLIIHRGDIGLFLEAQWALLMSTLSGAIVFFSDPYICWNYFLYFKYSLMFFLSFPPFLIKNFPLKLPLIVL